MAVSLPNGTIHALAATYAAPLTVTAASNATETVLSVSNTLSAGDIVEVTSGWNKISGRTFRVKTATGTTVTLEGVDADTTNTTDYPVGGGTGSIRKVLTWTQLSQTLSISSSGGEQQSAKYQFVEESFERSIPTFTSAIELQMTFADDITLPWYSALKAAAKSRAEVSLRGALSGGGVIYYKVVVGFNVIPSLNVNEPNKVNATFSLQGEPVRYAS